MHREASASSVTFVEGSTNKWPPAEILKQDSDMTQTPNLARERLGWTAPAPQTLPAHVVGRVACFLKPPARAGVTISSPVGC